MPISSDDNKTSSASSSQDRSSAMVRGALDLLPTFSPLVAPTMLALSGMLYLAGWGYQRSMLRRFGLSPDMFEDTLQNTFARGYIPVVIGTLVAAALMALIAWIYFKAAPKAVVDGDGFLHRVSTLNLRLFRANGLITGALLLFSYGVITGGLMGEAAATTISTDVEAGCHGACFRYVSGKDVIIGRMIVQDRSHTAIYSARGLVIVKNDALTEVVPLKRVSRTGISARDFRETLWVD